MKQLLTWTGVTEDITIHKEYQFYGNAPVGFKFKDNAGEPRETRHGTWATVTKGVQPSNTFLDQQETRDKNCGDSDYSKHKIQPWDIWIEYDLNGFDADIVKRVLRTKKPCWRIRRL